MGINAAILDFYANMKCTGVFADVRNVIELGSQTIDLDADAGDLLRAFDKPMRSYAGASARALYEALGWQYDCIDIDGNFDAIVLDLNFETIGKEYCGRFDLVTNFGTAEHIFNQFNVFKTMHDLAGVGGFILNALPMIGCFDHGFFNYHPNMLRALNKYNGYEEMGAWINVIGAKTLTPAGSKWPTATDYLIVTLVRKTSPRDFVVPLQGHYETTVLPSAKDRYDRPASIAMSA